MRDSAEARAAARIAIKIKRAPTPSAVIKDDPGADSDSTIEMDPADYMHVLPAQPSPKPEIKAETNTETKAEIKMEEQAEEGLVKDECCKEEGPTEAESGESVDGLKEKAEVKEVVKQEKGSEEGGNNGAGRDSDNPSGEESTENGGEDKGPKTDSTCNSNNTIQGPALEDVGQEIIGGEEVLTVGEEVLVGMEEEVLVGVVGDSDTQLLDQSLAIDDSLLDAVKVSVIRGYCFF